MSHLFSGAILAYQLHNCVVFFFYSSAKKKEIIHVGVCKSGRIKPMCSYLR